MSHSQTVYITNIPYHASEADIIRICCEAGTVLRFHFLVDKQTGQRKGAGFCKYANVESAQRAIRLLHRREYHGHRLLFSVAVDRRAAAAAKIASDFVDRWTSNQSEDDLTKSRDFRKARFGSTSPEATPSPPSIPSQTRSSTPSPYYPIVSKRRREEDMTKVAGNDGLALPPVQKKRKLDNDTVLAETKKLLISAVNEAKETPAKVQLSGPLSSDLVADLKQWGMPHYMVHYKEKKKRVECVPGDMRHEMMDVTVYKLEVYW